MSDPTTSLPPGFRFHPTDEELIHHYLRKRAAAVPCPVSIIAEVDIYKFDPWELPAKAKFGDREWYFFSPRDRKYPNGVRPNRAAASGYWKATGTDKPISSGKENIGVKKALVFYKGKPPKGLKTNWIMHEYRLAEAQSSNNYRPLKLKDHSMRLDDWVLCRIYNKGNHLQPVPPLMEQEQDDSGTEDIYLPASSQTVTQDNANPPKLHASASISDFLDYSVLSHLFDCQPELPGSDQGSILSQPGSNFINNATHNIGGGNGSNYQLPQLLQVESPAPIVDANLKRQRPQEDGGSEDGGRLLNPLKRRNESCLVNSFSNHTQYDGPQYNLLSQPFFNQQLLLKSHLGIQ